MRDRSIGSRICTVLIYFVLTLFAIFTFIPVLHVFAGSITPLRESLANSFVLWPKEPTLESYQYILSTATMPRALGITVYVTLMGTFINIAMTTIMAYPLAHTRLMGRRVILFLVTFTMLFGGGMIPNYLIVKGTGLMDSLLSLMIPGAISAYNLILMKNFFQQIPAELEESARLDGCNDLYILFRIVLPLSMPAIATFTLFYAVGHWNTFMNALLYLNDPEKWTIQVLLRQIVILSQGGIGDAASMGETFVMPPQGVKMAAIVFSTFPILCAYPFLQKYFVKGIMAGSIKG